MPRCARQKSESGIFHIIFRGVNKQIIFEDEEDIQRFIDTLEKYKTVCGYQIFGYCLMSNHIHLLIKEKEEISKIVKRICSSYVYWYNRKYRRCGHLFQERYGSECIETDGYLQTVLRYIHQNPIKAGVVSNINRYDWSSYKSYITTERKGGIEDIDFVLNIFSEDRAKAVKLFIEHTEKNNNDTCLEIEENTSVSDIEILKKIKSIGIQTVSQLQSMDRGERNKLLREIKLISGVTIRQISRVTGISKSVIGRA